LKLPGWRKRTRHREGWQPVLEAEVRRWSKKPWQQLLVEVPHQECYRVELQGKEYNVEVQLLENNSDYIHVAVSVDDGSIPMSFHPLSDSFILYKRHQDSGV